MTLKTASATALASLLLCGCAATSSREPVLPPQTQYDAILTTSAGTPLSIDQLAMELTSADVVVIGEFHGHHGAHLLQSLLQSALYQQRPQQVLTMEQFTLADQAALDRYLAGRYGEAELIADTDAWPNYKASYRPLVEFAKDRNLPVIAANAPADTVRCVGRQGPEYLTRLDAKERAQLPRDAFADTPEYRQKFFQVMTGGHGDADISKRLDNTYRAQLLRDNTMAWQVIQAMDTHPEHQIVHVTGTFHAEDRLGMVAVLEQRRPDLDVAVVSPVFWQADDAFTALHRASQQKGDYLYYLQPLPEAYRDAERQQAAIREQFHSAAKVPCD